MTNDASDDAMSNVLEANDEADDQRDHVQSIELPSMPRKEKMKRGMKGGYLLDSGIIEHGNGGENDDCSQTSGRNVDENWSQEQKRKKDECATYDSSCRSGDVALTVNS